MPQKRLPRFKRDKKVPSIELTERDRKIIRQVYRYRFLRSPQVVSLVGGSSQQVLRRLQLLYHHGYLERPRAQIDYYHKGGSRHIVHGLGDKGRKLLTKECGLPVDKRHWSEKNRVIGRFFLEHALLISEVLVALELACLQSKEWRLRVEDDLPVAAGLSRSTKSFKWKVGIKRGEKLGIVPDRTLALESMLDPGNPVFFFLEADRATMPVIRKNFSQTSFYRKLVAYEATWSQSLHRKQFGFHRFRVLTVTSSSDRVDSLLTACAKLERGHGLFLFTDAESLRKASNLFDLPWRSGRDGRSSTLLD